MKRGVQTAALFVLPWFVCLSSTAVADDPCGGRPPSVVQEFSSSVPPRALCRGRFDIKTLGAGGFEVLHFHEGKVTLRKRFSQTRDVVTEGTLAIRSHQIAGCPAVSFSYYFGAGGAVSCHYLVLSRGGRFGVLPVDGELKDLDGDGESELVVSEYEPWFENCALSRADALKWTRIFRIDPKADKPIDASNHFPRYYASEAKQYREIYNRLPSDASSECRAGLRELIQKAEALGRQTK